MPRKWYEGRVSRVERATENTKLYWLDLGDERDDFIFKPGQFITCDLPIGEKRLDRWRSYSISNQPFNSDGIELCIGMLEDGRASKYFDEQVDQDTIIKFKGPEGMFILPEKIDQDMVFICTGTGVAPFRSMISHFEETSWPEQKVHLIFGTRQKKDILYHDEFLGLAEKHPKFKYSVALSREEYKDYQGYVHGIYRRHYTGNIENKQFYLCGWSYMVDEAREILSKEMGAADHQIHYELYG